MAQSQTVTPCARIASPSDAVSGAIGCRPGVDGATFHNGHHDAITVIDHSWGLPGLGPDGTIALGAMTIAAATVSAIAWRALTTGSRDTSGISRRP